MKMITVSEACHTKLTSLKQHPRETYGDVVDRLIQEHEKLQSPEPKENSEKGTPDLFEELLPFLDSGK